MEANLAPILTKPEANGDHGDTVASSQSIQCSDAESVFRGRLEIAFNFSPTTIVRREYIDLLSFMIQSVLFFVFC